MKMKKRVEVCNFLLVHIICNSIQTEAMNTHEFTRLLSNVDLPACGFDNIHNAETRNSGRRIEWMSHVTWKKMKDGIARRFDIVCFGVSVSRKLVH